MLSDYVHLVVNSLTSRKTRSYLTLIGIFIGIAAVISLIGLGEGLRTVITDQFGFLGSDILTIQAAGLNNQGPPGSYVVNPLSSDLAAKIERIPNVNVAVNREIKMTTVDFNNKQAMGFIVTAPNGPNRKFFTRSMNFKAASGRMLKDGDSKKIVVGNRWTGTEQFGKPLVVGDSVMINNTKFEIIGILEKKGSFTVDRAIVMNEDIFHDVFGDTKKADIIMVAVKDVNQISQTQAEIEKLLRKERNVKVGEEDFTVQTPQKTLETLNSTLLAIQIFVYIIAGISIVVGGIGITNTMYTSVLERTKDIGIMKSIGARNSFIFGLFALEAGFFGMIGGLMGILIGSVLAYGLSFIGRVLLGSGLIQAKISLMLVIGTLLFSFIVGIVAGLVPAYQASKMQPVEAVRYEK